MIRVLHVISGLGSGGTEGVLYRLLAAQDRSRFESTVVSLSGDGVWGDRMRNLGVEVEVIGMPKGLPTPGFRNRLRRFAKSQAPDLVMGWLYRGNLAAMWASHDARAPLVWNVRHSLHDWKREKPLFKLSVLANRWFSRKPWLVVFNSRTAMAQHLEFGFAQSETQVVPNGFDLERFRPNPEAREKWRREWGAETETRVVGLAARYHPTKNHVGFIRAAGTAAQAFPDVLFVLAGEGVDAENQELVAEICKTGFPEKFRLLGRVDAVESVIAAWDLAVNASFGEAFPNAVGEALACGFPCLATDVGDSAWIVQDAGLVVPEKNLAKAMTEMVRRKRSDLAELGRRGREWVESGLRLSAMVDSFQQIYARSTSWKTSKSPS